LEAFYELQLLLQKKKKTFFVV